MKKFFKSKNIITISIALAIIIAVTVTAVVLGGNGVLSKAVNSVTKPIQTGITSVVNWLEDVYGYIYEYDQLEAENEELEKQIAEMQDAIREAEDLEEENERLRALLELSEQHSDFEYEIATVIARGSSNWNSYITISKGSSSGLEINDVVITEYGYVVGQITELGDSWATVRTIIDTETSVGAKLEDSGVTAVLTGDFTLMQDNCAMLSYIPTGTDLTKGELVLTSGDGGIYPAGLIIGEIEDVAYEDTGLTTYGIIRCAADMDSLSQVFIITDFEISD